MEIYDMNLSDFDRIKDILETEFDNFWNASILESELKSDLSKYIVAKIENVVVGFAGILITPDDTQITNIVTKKSERNNGIGEALLNRLIEISIGLKKNSISLEVSEANFPAISLYEKAGFEVVRRKKEIL